MLNISNVSISFQGEYLFNGISFKLNPGNRIGLVGKNGAGKSTMLKILSGDIEPDTGQIAKEKGTRIGFLRQDIDFEEGRTVLDEAYQAFTTIKSLEQQLEEINKQLAERSDYESDSYNELIVQLNEVQHQYEIHGGYNYQGNTERILQGLGFSRDDFDKYTETFSGGWRMRIELAKLLLQNNDILLLDEPTNHLDIESIIWLEGFLKNYAGCVVIVSHDKMFLDQVTNRTIEILLGNIYDYNQPYSKYLEIRKERREQQAAAQKNQQKEIAHTEKLIEKFKAKASKASMAQSLMKKLEKIDRIEVDETDNSVMTLNFPVSVTPGKVVVDAEHIVKNYGDVEVLKGVKLEVARGDKIAFVGQNGQGKSTLAKIIVGEINYQGNLKLGHNVQIGYFAQNQAEYLDGNKTVLDTMIDAANASNRTKVRDILGAFLFRGEEADKYVKVLSGGERNRLALAKLMLQPFNVLVMDEPTNHLDILSKNVLKEALKRFEGTLIVVSHDRDFLQGLTNKVYEFKEHKLTEFLGDIEYYLEERAIDNLREAEKKTQKSTKEPVIAEQPAKLSYQQQKEVKSLKNKISNIEKQINKLEAELKLLDKKLASDYEKLLQDKSFFSDYEKKKEYLQVLMQDWEEKQLALDELSL
ncbi:ATP-binding cassette subfamily F protein 3 [Mesonia hippocampi]|uniref:Probable ATP-binding protein YbiT n=1 Tax=Mesonia hippocampi TaxID=1628250 RepID=A0A840EP28_9FLAO|nr:ABC-F family ATP-binding cassette domain-containing protein [Mesonia hippocampi]MBB4118730.1 ATP-binding cassette subfamily F protein 3 [Mesonia hippocampi]